MVKRKKSFSSFSKSHPSIGVIHAYVRLDKLAAVVISDNDYSKRVAHSLLVKVRFPNEIIRLHVIGIFSGHG